MSKLARRSHEAPSRAAWFAIGSVSTLGGLWILAALWRRAWGITSNSPEPVPEGGNPTPVTE